MLNLIIIYEAILYFENLHLYQKEYGDDHNSNYLNHFDDILLVLTNPSFIILEVLNTVLLLHNTKTSGLRFSNERTNLLNNQI